jgi:hypothetical protein
MTDEKMLSTAEAAKLFGISHAQAVRWARRYSRQLGTIQITPRGSWRWPESRALAALAGGLRDEDEP